MKIRLFSDMHTEFKDHQLDIPKLDTDHETVLILAGDIGVGTKAVNPIKGIADRFKHVIYVAGNHEFYNHNIDHVEHYLKTKAFEDRDNIHYLSNTSVLIDGIRFYGGTMWTPMGFGKPDVLEVRNQINYGMNDFRCVKTGDDEITFSAYDAAKIHQEFIEGLDHVFDLAMENREELFVVTHHAPTEKSVDTEFKGQVLNAAYHADLDDTIKLNDDVLKHWVHGHMHHSTEYMVGDCKVFTNPYGYHPYATNKEFTDTKVWEI